MTTRRPLQFLSALLLVYLIVPVVAFLVRFSGSHERGFNIPGLGPALVVSLKTATISLIISTLLGVPLGYVLARARGRPATMALVAVQLPLALPPIMSGILLIYLIGPYSFLGRHVDSQLTNSLAGIVIAQTFVSAPFVVVAARSAFQTIDPALDGLAATMGHRPLARFWLIDVQIARPGIIAGMVLTWLRAFGEYGAVIIVAYHPFSLPVYTEYQFSADRAARHSGTDVSRPLLRCSGHRHQPRDLVAAGEQGRSSRSSPLRRRQPHPPRWRSTWIRPSGLSTSAWPIRLPATASPSWAPRVRVSR